jgi:hypothetical protein
MTTLLRTERLPKEEREELRKLVEDLWPSKESGHGISE